MAANTPVDQRGNIDGDYRAERGNFVINAGFYMGTVRIALDRLVRIPFTYESMDDILERRATRMKEEEMERQSHSRPW